MNIASILRRKIASLIYLTKYRFALITERWKGVDFTRNLLKDKIGTEGDPNAYFYGSTTLTPTFNKALKFVNITNQDAILDIGCGKGPVLLSFTKLPFRRIAGIELSASLVDICKANFKKLGISNVEVICADATTFNDLDDYTYFYFGNPFNQTVLDIVLNNIIESYRRRERKITLIYFHALVRTAVVDPNKFENIKEFTEGTRTIKIYTLNSHALKKAQDMSTVL